MYEAHFGLDRPPFQITPDPSLFFDGGKRGAILDALAYAIERGEGIIKVVGEVGSGKTMLCRMMELRLPESVELIYVANPSLSADDILYVIADELKLDLKDDASKQEVMRALQKWLIELHAANKQVVLFVEEAQGMPLQTLEEIRLLSNLETSQHKLLQIVLFGQPELDLKLSDHSIRQLRERISHSFDLPPLDAEEIHAYLNFRMRQVGYSGPEVISLKVSKLIEKYSKGLVRRVNIIADKALLAAFSDSTHDVTRKHVKVAADDSEFSEEAAKRRSNLKSPVPWILATAASMLLLVAGLFQFGFIQLSDDSQAKSPAAVATVSRPAASASVQHKKPVFKSPALNASEQPIEMTLALVDGADVEAIDPLVEDEPAPVADSIAETMFEVANADENNNQGTETHQREAIAVDAKQNDVMAKQVLVAMSAGSSDNKSLEKNIRRSISAVDAQKWLDEKVVKTRAWMAQAEKGHITMQVLMRRKSAAQELVGFLKNEWPLQLDQTYIYEVDIHGTNIYRVLYNDYESWRQGNLDLAAMPDSIKSNGPYLRNIYRLHVAALSEDVAMLAGENNQPEIAQVSNH